MATTHGASWRTTLMRALRHKRANGSATITASGKRTRLGELVEIASHEMGVGQRRRKPVLDSELLQDMTCGFRILRQVSGSGWWEWTGGSSLFFWRWNGCEQIKMARDGIPISVSAQLPKQRRQKPVRLNHEQRVMVAGKMDHMVRRDYLESGYVSNTVHFFAVPKGDLDIRVVFDGTSSGLNESLWAPNFFLPSARSASMCLSFQTWMADMDFGDFFHNFPMDRRIRPYSGVDLGPIASLVGSLDSNDLRPGATKPTVLRWTRLFMGMRPSPYLAIRHSTGVRNLLEATPNKRETRWDMTELD